MSRRDTQSIILPARSCAPSVYAPSSFLGGVRARALYRDQKHLRSRGDGPRRVGERGQGGLHGARGVAAVGPDRGLEGEVRAHSRLERVRVPARSSEAYPRGGVAQLTRDRVGPDVRGGHDGAIVHSAHAASTGQKNATQR